jgi:hypothetical protein
LYNSTSRKTEVGRLLQHNLHSCSGHVISNTIYLGARATEKQQPFQQEQWHKNTKKKKKRKTPHQQPEMRRTQTSIATSNPQEAPTISYP